MRIALVALCAIAIAAAATFLIKSEKTAIARRAAAQEFTDRAQAATAALADLRTAQQASVVIGQDSALWAPKVDAAAATIGTLLAALQQSASTSLSRSALDDAVAATAEFSAADRRSRDYLAEDAPLMAAGVVITEGSAAIARAIRDVEQARLEEQTAFDGLAAEQRQQRGIATGTAAVWLFLITLILALKPAVNASPVEATAISAVSRADAASGASDAREDDLLLRGEVAPADETAQTVVIPPPAEALAADPTLKAAAQLCTDLGRVSDLNDLNALLGRAAELLDASGVVLWVAEPSGSELRPALTYGYPASTAARIPAVPCSADNAAAAAYRSGSLQVVLAEPGSHRKGALVVPLLSADGCLGVLSAEMRGGAEAVDSVQALATIIAAQLGGVVTAPAPADTRAAV